MEKYLQTPKREKFFQSLTQYDKPKSEAYLFKATLEKETGRQYNIWI